MRVFLGAFGDPGHTFPMLALGKALVARGHEVRLLAREGSNLAGLPAGDIARGDVCDAASVRHAAEGCQAILHMAALVKLWVPEREAFDFAFIDADKPSYVSYVDELVPRLRPGGVLLIDNVLWHGSVIDPAADDDNVEAIRRCNDHVAGLDALESVILPVADGLTLARKR